jgi:hypothetical protein
MLCRSVLYCYLLHRPSAIALINEHRTTTRHWTDSLLSHDQRVVPSHDDSMPSNEFREQIEERYGKQIDDELWRIAMAGVGGQSKFKGNYEAAAAIFRILARNRRLEEEIRSREAKIKSLEQHVQQVSEEERQLLVLDIPDDRDNMPVSASDAKEYFVDNVSNSAKNYILRDVFRSEQVGLYPYNGGFVCHRMFVEFAKASLLMNNGTPERSEELKLLETDMKTTEEELDGLFGSLLSNGRTKKSLFSNDYPDEEAPQAALAAEMLRFALDSLKQKQKSRNESSGHIPLS